MAAWYWTEDGLREAALHTLLPAGRVISLVGGGGKTTLAHHLAAQGRRAAVMTTTKMGRPASPCLTMADCRAAWAQGAYAVCGHVDEHGHFRQPEGDCLAALMAEAELLVVEADGAHRRPCKAPADHEPVLLPQTDVVLAVMGVDALDQPVAKVCHRPERVTAILGCDGDHRLTAEDAAILLASSQGGRKGVGDRGFLAVINKCDDPQRLRKGAEILRCLARLGVRGVCTAFTQRSERFEIPVHS